MAARRRYIDANGEYRLVNGSPEEDMSPASRVVLRLRTRRGTVTGLPNFGCRLFDIRKLTSSSDKLAKSYVLEALDDLVKSGQLPGLDVKVTAANSALSVVISYRDPAGVRKVVPYSYKVI